MATNNKIRVADRKTISKIYVSKWVNRIDNLLHNKGINCIDAQPEKVIDIVEAGISFDGVLDKVQGNTGDDGLLFSLKGTWIVAFDDTTANDVFDEDHLFSPDDYINVNSKANDIYLIRKLSLTTLSREQQDAVQEMFSVDTPMTNLSILVPLTQVLDKDLSKVKIEDYPDDVDEITSINLRPKSNTFLLSKLFVKGSTTDEDITDLDMQIEAVGAFIGIIKALPVSLQQKLVLFFPWLNANDTLNFQTVKKYWGVAGGVDISQEFSNMSGADNAQNKPARDLYRTLISILMATKEEASGWADFPRDPQVGKIIETSKIFQTLLQSKEGQTIEQICAGMIDTFKLQYPNFVLDEALWETFTQIVVALSEYIKSETYAFARGGNKYNEIYFPWTLRARSPITVNRTNDGVVSDADLKQSFKVEAASQWFDFVSTKGVVSIKLKDKWKRTSFYQTIRLDATIPIAELPAELDVENAAYDVASIDPSKSDITKYMFYLATDSGAKFENLLSSNATIINKGTEQVRDFDTGWQNGYSYSYVEFTHDTPQRGTITTWTTKIIFYETPYNQDKSGTTLDKQYGHGASWPANRDFPNNWPIVDAYDYSTSITQQMVIDNSVFIPNGYSLKMINGNPDFSYKIETRIDDQYETHTNGHRVGGKYLFRISGTFRVVANRDIVVPSIVSENAIMDKGTYNKFIDLFSTKPLNYKFTLENGFLGTGQKWKSIYSIPIISVYGDHLDLEIHYKDTKGVDKSYIINNIETFNINNEANTLNIIFLNFNVNK